MQFLEKEFYIRDVHFGLFESAVEDGGGLIVFACLFGQTPSPVRVLPLIQEGEFFLLFSIVYKEIL